jgi:hypothetical protein
LIYINFWLKAFNAFCVVTILTIWQYNEVMGKSEDFYTTTFIYKLTLRTLVSFTDSLNLCTILYLFYFQGKKAKRVRSP